MSSTGTPVGRLTQLGKLPKHLMGITNPRDLVRPFPVAKCTGRSGSFVYYHDTNLATDLLVRGRAGRGHVVFCAATLSDLFRRVASKKQETDEEQVGRRSNDASVGSGGGDWRGPPLYASRGRRLFSSCSDGIRDGAAPGASLEQRDELSGRSPVRACGDGLGALFRKSAGASASAGAHHLSLLAYAFHYVKSTNSRVGGRFGIGDRGQRRIWELGAEDIEL